MELLDIRTSKRTITRAYLMVFKFFSRRVINVIYSDIFKIERVEQLK